MVDICIRFPTVVAMPTKFEGSFRLDWPRLATFFPHRSGYNWIQLGRTISARRGFLRTKLQKRSLWRTVS